MCTAVSCTCTGSHELHRFALQPLLLASKDLAVENKPEAATIGRGASLACSLSHNTAAITPIFTDSLAHALMRSASSVILGIVRHY